MFDNIRRLSNVIPIRVCKRTIVYFTILSFLCILCIRVLQKDKQTMKCDPFPYDFPLANVTKVVNDIIVKGFTTVKPINNIFDSFHMIFSLNCPNDTQLIVVVKSYVGHFDQREAIRNTWGRYQPNVKVVFALGYSEWYKHLVKEEYLNLRDVIQGSFQDEYRHNIYKTTMCYHWLATKCSKSNFVFFVDDDFFVNIPNLIHFAVAKKTNTTNVMFGYKQCAQKPVRKNDTEYGKWYLSEEEYPYDILPNFLSGGSVLTHMNVVKKIRLAIPFVKIIPLDDIYISLVAEKLDIELMKESNFVFDEEKRKYVKYIISSHYYKAAYELRQAWQSLT